MDANGGEVNDGTLPNRLPSSRADEEWTQSSPLSLSRSVCEYTGFAVLFLPCFAIFVPSLTQQERYRYESLRIRFSKRYCRMMELAEYVLCFYIKVIV